MIKTLPTSAQVSQTLLDIFSEPSPTRMLAEAPLYSVWEIPGAATYLNASLTTEHTGPVSLRWIDQSEVDRNVVPYLAVPNWGHDITVGDVCLVSVGGQVIPALIGEVSADLEAPEVSPALLALLPEGGVKAQIMVFNWESPICLIELALQNCVVGLWEQFLMALEEGK